MIKIPPLAVMVICLVLSATTHTLMPITQFDAGYVAPSIFGFLGIGFVYFAVMDFRKHKTTVNPLQLSNATSLVTTGVYSISRNPMYVGMTLLTLSFAIFLGTLSAFFAPVLFVVYITKFQIKPEEQALNTIFGEEWATYQKTTRRWL